MKELLNLGFPTEYHYFSREEPSNSKNKGKAKGIIIHQSTESITPRPLIYYQYIHNHYHTLQQQINTCIHDLESYNCKILIKKKDDLLERF